MFSIRNLRLSPVFLVILVSLVFITTFPIKGYCEGDWVLIRETELFSSYYNLPSVNIDTNNHIIKVWTKKIYTEKGKKDLLNKSNDNEKQKYNEINRIVRLFDIDYKERKFNVENLSIYSNSGIVLNYSSWNNIEPNEWRNIEPDDGNDIIINKIMKDNNIQR